MTVAYAAIHRHLLYRGQDTGLYAVALDDGSLFINTEPPTLFDCKALKIPWREVRELLPGSRVNVVYEPASDHMKLMTAIQIVSEPVQSAPFKPVHDNDDDP